MIRNEFLKLLTKLNKGNFLKIVIKINNSILLINKNVFLLRKKEIYLVI